MYTVCVPMFIKHPRAIFKLIWSYTSIISMIIMIYYYYHHHYCLQKARTATKWIQWTIAFKIKSSVYSYAGVFFVAGAAHRIAPCRDLTRIHRGIRYEFTGSDITERYFPSSWCTRTCRILSQIHLIYSKSKMVCFQTSWHID